MSKAPMVDLLPGVPAGLGGAAPAGDPVRDLRVVHEYVDFAAAALGRWLDPDPSVGQAARLIDAQATAQALETAGVYLARAAAAVTAGLAALGGALPDGFDASLGRLVAAAARARLDTDAGGGS